jgi:hypothetical protein
VTPRPSQNKQFTTALNQEMATYKAVLQVHMADIVAAEEEKEEGRLRKIHEATRKELHPEWYGEGRLARDLRVHDFVNIRG